MSRLLHPHVVVLKRTGEGDMDVFPLSVRLDNLVDGALLVQSFVTENLYTLPLFPSYGITPRVVFDELKDVLKNVHPLKLERLLSGISCYEQETLVLEPRKDLSYTLLYVPGRIVKDGSFPRFYYEEVPRLEFCFHKKAYHLKDVPYLLEQVHLLSGIFAAFWGRNAVIKSDLVSEIESPVIPICIKENFGRKSMNAFNGYVSKMRLTTFSVKKSSKPFESLTWEDIQID